MYLITFSTTQIMCIEVRAVWGTTLLNSEHFNLVWIRVYRKSSRLNLTTSNSNSNSRIPADPSSTLVFDFSALAALVKRGGVWPLLSSNPPARINLYSNSNSNSRRRASVAQCNQPARINLNSNSNSNSNSISIDNRPLRIPHQLSTLISAPLRHWSSEEAFGRCSALIRQHE